MLMPIRETFRIRPWTKECAIINNDPRPMDMFVIGRPWWRPAGTDPDIHGVNVQINFHLTLPHDFRGWQSVADGGADHLCKIFNVHPAGGPDIHNSVRAYLDGDRFRFSLVDTGTGQGYVASGPMLEPGRAHSCVFTAKLCKPGAIADGFFSFMVDDTVYLKKSIPVIWPNDPDPYICLGLDARTDKFPPSVTVIAARFDVWVAKC